MCVCVVCMCVSCRWCVVWVVRVCMCAYVGVFDSNGKTVSMQIVISRVRSPSTSVAHLWQKL